VYNASDIDNIIDTLGNGETVTINATQFAAFYYDHNNNVSTESLSIRDIEGTQGNIIGEYGLVYQTKTQNTSYRFKAWGEYPVICLFGEQHVPLKPADARKFAKLILDSNDIYTLGNSDLLDLGKGYTLEVKQIDIEGNRVWLEFDKDGQHIDDQIISTDFGNGTWTCKLDNIQGENNVSVLKVHIKKIFQDVNRVTEIDGLWLIDYANTTDILSSNELNKLNNVSIDGKVISENDLRYNITIENVDYNYSDPANGWGTYPVVSLFGNKYLPLKPDDIGKLSRLVLDSNDTYTINTGNIIDLGQGYILEVKQVNLDGEFVWFKFYKDGKYVDESIIGLLGDGTWTCKLDDIQGENDVVVLKVHVKHFPQGSINGVIKIDGLWLIDYANAVDIYSSNEFGKLNNVSIDGATLSISNKYAFTLTRDSEQEIAKEIYFKVADTPVNLLRFYSFKQITDPGAYEIRGQVASGANDQNWDARNFAGFYYDFGNNFATESLTVSNISGNVIGKNGLVYNTSVTETAYQYKNAYNAYSNWGTYNVICLFGEQYVPLKPTDASKLFKLILDSNNEYTLKTGDVLDLGEGYTLEVKQIDVDGEKLWLEFDKDGQYVDDRVVSVDGGGYSTWNVKLDNIQGENDVTVLKVHFKRIFQDTVNNIAEIDGIWLIDYANILNVEPGDEFGKLNNVKINGNTLTITNNDNFILTGGSDPEIAKGFYFKVANTSATELRYYPFVKRFVRENNDKVIPIADFSTNVTSGYAPLSVKFTDLSKNAILWDWNFGDGSISTEQSPAHTFTAAGTYNVNLKASNENGTVSKTATIKVWKKNSSSGGSGGGGGAGGSPESAKNVEVKELSQIFITNGNHVIFDFPKNVTAIVYLGFDSKKTAGKTTTIVEMLKNQSTLTPEAPEGEVYTYLNIWVGNNGYATSNNIENATVCFRVKKSWIEDKDIEKSSIILNRYNNTKWNALQTILLSEDDKYLYFKAETPGFSPFVITGKKASKGTGTEIQPQTENIEDNSANTDLGIEQKPIEEENTSTSGKVARSPSFEIVYGVAALLAVFLHKRK
jgi:S-layer protein (TIGR01567 family)